MQPQSRPKNNRGLLTVEAAASPKETQAAQVSGFLHWSAQMKIGDVVYNYSKTRKMTVAKIDAYCAECWYFIGSTLHKRLVPMWMLSKSE